MQPSELVALAKEYGDPLYVYDTEKIENQYNRLSKAFSKVDRLRINYAMKALSNYFNFKIPQHVGIGPGYGFLARSSIGDACRLYT